jgi:hypothetical protein
VSRFQHNDKDFMNIIRNMFVVFILHSSNAVLAANPSQEGTSLESEQQEMLDIGKSVFAGNVDALTNKAIESISQEGVGLTKSYLEKYFPTVEVSFDMLDNNNPTSSLLFLLPLSDPDDIKNTFFTQNSIYYRDNRTTINMGLGYRRLELDNKLLLGINAFYDHEFPYDHGRTSIGLEARTTIGEINFNRYWATTDWKTGEQDLQEQALGGADIEIGAPLPYMDWAKLYVRGFTWDAVNGANNLEGSDISLRVQVPPIPGLTFEVGQRNYKDSTPDDNFLRISYNVMDLMKEQRSQPLFSQTAYSLSSMENERFAKVRRENLIVKQTGFTVGIKGF